MTVVSGKRRGRGEDSIFFDEAKGRYVGVVSLGYSPSGTRVQAMIELGRAQKTIFLARYLRSRALQREIHEGLNVVESWNRANTVIFYGKGSDLASNHRDEQEMSVLRLRILQAALVYVNTLMLQDLLAEPDGDDVLTPEDQRGLTPLFWSHVCPTAR